MYNMYFIFFISASQISPMIKIYNMNLYDESAESQLPIKILDLNNCMFGKLINIFSVFFFVQYSLFLFILQFNF